MRFFLVRLPGKAPESLGDRLSNQLFLLFSPIDTWLVTEYVDSLPFWQLVANIGGTMGIWTGSSIVSLIHMAFYLFAWCLGRDEAEEEEQPTNTQQENRTDSDVQQKFDQLNGEVQQKLDIINENVQQKMLALMHLENNALRIEMGNMKRQLHQLLIEKTVEDETFV